MSDAGFPAGWHPDPGGIHELRYWDGSAWTEHVSNGGVTSTAAVTMPPAEPTEAAPPPVVIAGAPAPPTDSRPAPPGSGPAPVPFASQSSGRPWWVLAIVGGVAALVLLVGGIAVVSKGGGGGGTSGSMPMDDYLALSSTQIGLMGHIVNEPEALNNLGPTCASINDPDTWEQSSQSWPPAMRKAMQKLLPGWRDFDEACRTGEYDEASRIYREKVSGPLEELESLVQKHCKLRGLGDAQCS